MASLPHRGVKGHPSAGRADSEAAQRRSPQARASHITPRPAWPSGGASTFNRRANSRIGALKIATLLLAGKDAQAQKLAVGFTSFAGPLSPGAFQQLALNVHPGYWVLACFMNTQDGREHTQLGMERVIHIEK
jgi:hypothetical protein